MTNPVDEPGEAKRLWLLNLEPQDAGKLFNCSSVGSVKLVHQQLALLL
jgi:hypothetical protein